ncbi:MAG: hypothetical protein HUU37_00855 [Bdellovibrionales bacterium]|nr:hypothetical protein [Bdellovibrionales bacterium]
MSGKGDGSLRVVLVVALVTAVTLFFVWTRLQNTRLRIESSRLQEAEKQALADVNRVKAEWARLISPARLEEIGAKKYNLGRPKPHQIVVLKE